MIVVADAGPLHYLVLIGAVDVLQPFYSRVLAPQTVAEELQETNTPAVVRAWIEQPPEWFEIRPDPLRLYHPHGKLRANCFK
jgi:predicted nucleic acid-binding protein